MFQNDFIMREIEGLTRAIAKTVFHKDLDRGEVIDEAWTVSGGELLLRTLMRLVADGQINEAENLLHQRLEEEPRREYLETATRFYTHLAELSDEELARCDFSREEIGEGIAAVKRIFGIVE